MTDEQTQKGWQDAKDDLQAIFGDQPQGLATPPEDVLPEKVIEEPADSKPAEADPPPQEEAKQEEAKAEPAPQPAAETKQSPDPSEAKAESPPAPEPTPEADLPLVMDEALEPVQPSIQQEVHVPAPQSKVVSVPTVALTTVTTAHTPPSPSELETPQFEPVEYDAPAPEANDQSQQPAQAQPKEAMPEQVDAEKEPPVTAIYPAPTPAATRETTKQFIPEPVPSKEVPDYLPERQYQPQAPLHEPKVGEHRYGVTLSTNLGRGWFLGCLQETGEERAVYVRRDPDWLKLHPHKLLPKYQQIGDFVVLETMQGEALPSALPASQAMTFVNELARLVFSLEKQGFALTDIDPENMFSTPDGLHLCLMPRVHPIGHPTRSAMRDGYDPPELQAGVSADARSGVYLIGALLYKWMVGKPLPVEGATPFVLRAVREPGIPQLLNKMLSRLHDRLTPTQLLAELRNLSQQRMACYLTEGATTVGLSPDRLSNEDAYGFVHLHLHSEELPVAHLRACVADGMGGMEAGARASAAAVRGFLNSNQNTLVDRVWDANAAVLSAMQQSNGGCTLSGVEIIGDQLQIGHVGDCRVYVYDGELKQLSEDHSYVAKMVASGQMTEEEAQNSPERNKVLKSLGHVRKPTTGYVQTLSDTVTLKPGHRVLMVSDGVWGEVSELKMAQVLKEEQEAKQAVARLIQLTLNAGAPDNATAVLIERRE